MKHLIVWEKRYSGGGCEVRKPEGWNNVPEFCNAGLARLTHMICKESIQSSDSICLLPSNPVAEPDLSDQASPGGWQSSGATNAWLVRRGSARLAGRATALTQRLPSVALP
jgi:hypothetical protein